MKKKTKVSNGATMFFAIPLLTNVLPAYRCGVPLVCRLKLLEEADIVFGEHPKVFHPIF